MFRRGHLLRFLAAATVLVLNGAVIVYLFERHAPSSNIHSFETGCGGHSSRSPPVGYGDFYRGRGWVCSPGRRQQDRPQLWREVIEHPVAETTERPAPVGGVRRRGARRAEKGST